MTNNRYIEVSADQHRKVPYKHSETVSNMQYLVKAGITITVITHSVPNSEIIYSSKFY